MEFEAIYTVKKEIKKESFLREVLITLGKNSETPPDIVNVKFGEVKESVREALLCSAFIQGTCTASIGYDRQEPYTDYETYKEKVGDTYVNRQRAVIKYRTVTDWRPFNTDFSGRATYAVDNSDSLSSGIGIAHALKTASDDSIIEKGEATVNKQALSKALMECEYHVRRYNLELPGDKHKDERYNYSHEIETLSCYKLPFYEVTFTYEGKTYYASCFACGELSVHCDIPEAIVEDTRNPSEEIEDQVKELTKDEEKSAKQAWLTFLFSAAISAFACFLLKFCWLWPVSAALLFLAVMKNKKYNDAYEKYSDEIALDYAKKKSKSQASFLKEKIDALNQALLSYGYPPLSASETPVIDGESDSVISSNIPRVSEPKSFKKKAVICVLLTIALIISSFSVNSKELHSPKQVELGIVNKTVDFNPDEYMYGNYYVYFDFEVKAKKVGIDSLNLTVFVSDKEGIDLGTITASLKANAQKGETKTVTIHLSENQPEKDEFFSTLYKTDLADLNFRYEIDYISFSDGKDYDAD